MRAAGNLAAMPPVILVLSILAPSWLASGSHAAPPEQAPWPSKGDVLQRLVRLNQTGRFLFGEQNATLWGMYLDGRVVPTSEWFQKTAAAKQFTSDSAAVVGDLPAMLGVTLQMLAFEPTDFHRRPIVAEAMRHQMAEGGLVTMDWHAPSCNASLPPAETLATITADGQEVPLRAVAGGSLFYAEEEYTHPIASRADVPESLKCLCQIANNVPLSAGPYQGLTGKAWLVAHAKYAAEVLRKQGLRGAPIILRPFHEHNGNWFWWGRPYWNCAQLLDQPGAITGPAAYVALIDTFVSTLRAEPGMENLLFAYSPGSLADVPERAGTAPAYRKLTDPESQARDRLRSRLVRELDALGLAFVASPAPPGKMARGSGEMDRRARLRRSYIEAYAGDEVFDLLGIDIYYPLARPATRADLLVNREQLRAVADEASARGKPYALTEIGTQRLPLWRLAAQASKRQPFLVHNQSTVGRALARLFDPSDRSALLQHYGLTTEGPIQLAAKERATVVPRAFEDWFNRQLLALAKSAKVAYALVWQTYNPDGADQTASFFVPYRGHPEASGFRRFYSDPATCFLRDACASSAPK